MPILQERQMIIRNLRPGEGVEAATLAEAIDSAAHWPAAEYERLARNAFCLVAEDPPGEIAGLLAASAVGDEAELQNLAVAAEKRRRGIATLLLFVALDRLVAAGIRKIWLEVRESNEAAVAFYLRHGFHHTGRRLDYYQAPREDALILARELDQN